MIIQSKTIPKPGEVIYLVEADDKVKVADATLNAQKPKHSSVVQSNDPAKATTHKNISPQWVVFAGMVLGLLWLACKWVLRKAFAVVLFIGKSIVEYGLDRLATNQSLRRFNADMVSDRINRKADTIRANNNHVDTPVEFTYQGEPFSLDLTEQQHPHENIL